MTRHASPPAIGAREKTPSIFSYPQPVSRHPFEPEPNGLPMSSQMRRNRCMTQALRGELIGQRDLGKCLHVHRLLWTVGYLRQHCELLTISREHVVGEEGELVFPALAIRLEGYIRSIYALMFRDFPSDTSCQV